MNASAMSRFRLLSVTPSQKRRVAIALAAALGAGVLLPVPGVAGLASAAVPADGLESSLVVPSSMPVFEPQIGQGEPLLAGTPQTISLGPDAAASQSALVRVSVFDSAAALQISVAGAPALSMAANKSASTSVLVPVTNGTIPIVSTIDTNARVEVLALFNGDSTVAGATIALPNTVNRANTTSGIGAEPYTVGLTGLGGVPIEQVRAVHLTATLVSTAPAVVTIDGQELAIDAGSTSVTTVVTPSVAGDILVSSDDPAVQLSLDVRGYVVEAPQNALTLNGAGSYWPSESSSSDKYTISDNATTEVDVTTPGSSYVLTLVHATPATSLTVVDVGAEYRGRARGAVVDPVSGAQPQLILVPATDPVATVRRGSTELSLQTLGSIQAATAGEATGSGDVTVLAPSLGTVDATETLAFDFTGTATTSGSAPVRLDVTLDGQPYGSAAVTSGSSSFEWRFTAAVKESGTHTFGFSLLDRAGQTTTTQWTGEITVPDEADTVITQDTVVIGAADHAATVLGISSDTVSFAEDPNLSPLNVIVGDSSAAAPEGFLRRVIAIDFIDGIWVVTTVPATLDEVFLQVDYSSAQGLEVASAISTDPIAPEDAGTVSGVSAEVLGENEMDVTPFPGDVYVPNGDDGDVSVKEPASFAKSSKAGANSDTAFKATQSIELKTTFEKKAEKEGNSGGAGSAAVSVAVSAQIALELEVELRGSIKYAKVSPYFPLEVPYGNIDHFSSILTSSSKAEAKAAAVLEASLSKEWKSPTTHLSFVPNTFMVAFVPLVFTSGVGMKIAAKVEAKGALSLEFTTAVQAEQKLGFRFTDGKAVPVNQGPEMTFVPFALSKGTGLVGSLDISAGPEISYTSLLYGLTGPELTLSAKIGRTLSLSLTAEKVGVDAETYFKLGAELAATVRVPVINMLLIDTKILSFEKKWALADEFIPFADLFPGTPPPTAPAPDDEGEIDYGQGELADATEAVAALDVNGAAVKSSFFVEGPPDPNSVATYTQPVGGFPTNGDDYLTLSTGAAGTLFGTDGTESYEVRSLRGTSIFDATTLRIDLEVPPGVNCLIGFDFRFYSDEYPEFVGSRYNDAFLVELDKSTWTEQDGVITAPRNFAFDELGNPITINAAGPFTINAQNASGSGYHGATSALRASTPVTPGAHSLFISIFDVGDASYNSAVLLDGITFGAVENPATQCQAGVSLDG